MTRKRDPSRKALKSLQCYLGTRQCGCALRGSFNWLRGSILKSCCIGKPNCSTLMLSRQVATEPSRQRTLIRFWCKAAAKQQKSGTTYLKNTTRATQMLHSGHSTQSGYSTCSWPTFLQGPGQKLYSGIEGYPAQKKVEVGCRR